MAENRERESGAEECEWKYLIAREDKGGFFDLFSFLFCSSPSQEFLECSSSTSAIEDRWLTLRERRWVVVASVIVRKIIAFFRKPMALTGLVIEFLLNLLANNGGFVGVFLNLVTGRFVMPQRGSDTFFSLIGHLDPRVELCKGSSFLTWLDDESGGDTMIRSRNLVDLCIMASKLSYENDKVVKRIVENHWKMHFVEFFNCWNEYQKERSTQVFILSHKPEDANLVLISFRGTEPFDSDDWITDFDYSWYEIPKLGKVHMGFLEALGLGNRDIPSSFRFHLDTKNHSSNNSIVTPTKEDKDSAYHSVRTKLRSMLSEHKNAKFIVTGHSLGGALAILFPVVLLFHEEEALMQRLLAVYTFGQPRVGNQQLGNYMRSQICHPVPRYFRVVYCYDMVPRLPYDDKTFLYKHFGQCLYYNSFYTEKDMDEEPNKNYFGVRCLLLTHLNAVFELCRAFIMGYIYGSEYKEGWFSIMFKILAMLGISAHCPSNYVNSVRLGGRGLGNHIMCMSAEKMK